MYCVCMYMYVLVQMYAMYIIICMYVQVSEKLRRGLKEAKKQAKRALDMTVTVRECSLLSHTLSLKSQYY